MLCGGMDERCCGSNSAAEGGEVDLSSGGGWDTNTGTMSVGSSRAYASKMNASTLNDSGRAVPVVTPADPLSLGPGVRSGSSGDPWSGLALTGLPEFDMRRDRVVWNLCGPSPV